MTAGYMPSHQHNSQFHQHETASQSQSQSQKQKQTPLQDKEMVEYEQLRKRLRNAGIHKEYKWELDEKLYNLRDFIKMSKQMAQKRWRMRMSDKAPKSGGKSRRKHTRKSKRKSCRKSCRR